MKQHVVKRKILWGDLDALDIVFYPRYYEWIDGCSHLFFDALQLNLGVLFRERHIVFGLVETSCRYIQSGRYFQDIAITTSIKELTPKTVTLRHHITSDSDGERMVEGMETRICLDVEGRDALRAIDIPKDIFSVLNDARNDHY